MVSSSKYHAWRAGMGDYKDRWEEKGGRGYQYGFPPLGSTQGDLLPMFSTT